MKTKLMNVFLLFSVLFLPINGLANGSSDYLILQDIAQYKLTKGLLFRGKMVGAEPKVSRVGNDVNGFYTSYETSYAGGEGYSAPKVEIRVYESTQWLLHEVEDAYRSDEILNETTDTNVQMRLIDGNNLFFIGIYGGKSYTWINNNNIVIDISCSSCPNTKPEPLEIVKAYLAKHPSTITLTDSELKSPAHNEKWLKDEMDRRLWLGGKWMGQIKTVADLDKLNDVVKNLNVFLDYREKYYGIEVGAEKNVLFTAQQNKDKTTIEAKLNEYYKWWNENKDKAINL